jgi:hypothetical protein
MRKIQLLNILFSQEIRNSTGKGTEIGGAKIKKKNNKCDNNIE